MSEKQELIEREDAKPVPATAVRSPVDVIEDESGITLSADLPGVTKDTLQVRVDGDTLMVEGEASLDIPLTGKHRKHKCETGQPVLVLEPNQSPASLAGSACKPR